jgi:hypothetical protein
MMTTIEMQHRFNLEMERYGIYEPVMMTIIQDYINYAYQQYVTEKYDSLINNVEKFEITERITKILAPLISTMTEETTFTAFSDFSLSGVYVKAPSDMQYIIAERAEMSITDCNGDTQTVSAKVIVMKHNKVEANINNPFVKPDSTHKEIWRVSNWESSDNVNRIDLIPPSDGTITKYVARYIKKITPVNLYDHTTIEIDNSVHEEIVVRAANMYLQPKQQEDEKDNS